MNSKTNVSKQGWSELEVIEGLNVLIVTPETIKNLRQLMFESKTNSTTSKWTGFDEVNCFEL